MAACCCLPGENILFKDIHINHWEVVAPSAIFVLGIAYFPSDVTLTELVVLAWEDPCIVTVNKAINMSLICT